jgi:hypothetical protein
MEYEIRLCILNTKNVPVADIEGTSDVYIQTYIDADKKQTTDTHYRCMNGEASFNYRQIFGVKAPRKQCLLVL